MEKVPFTPLISDKDPVYMVNRLMEVSHHAFNKPGFISLSHPMKVIHTASAHIRKFETMFTRTHGGETFTAEQLDTIEEMFTDVIMLLYAHLKEKGIFANSTTRIPRYENLPSFMEWFLSSDPYEFLKMIHANLYRDHLFEVIEVLYYIAWHLGVYPDSAICLEEFYDEIDRL